MNEVLKSIILGIIQGLTEFLPVSSSGHLELAKYILKDDSLGSESLLMSVLLHAATALSTIIIFRKDILEILRGLFPVNLQSFSWKFAINIVISMIPAVIVGLLFEDTLEMIFDKQILLVGFMLLLTGGLLLLADRAKTTEKDITKGHAIIVGVAQAIAILPGISRSGATIATSVLLGIDRSKAARFSFLMVVPLIFGKVAKDILSGDLNQAASNAPMEYIAGFVAAFLTGLFACQLMIRLVKSSKLYYFSLYCFIIGLLAIGWWFYAR